MQTAVRKRAADFDFWGDTPTPEFCENSRERGPRSPAGTAQGFDPPLGPHRSAAGTGGGCAGAGRVRRKGGGVPRRAGRGRAFAWTARARRSARRRGGRFRRWKPGRSLRAAGRQRDAGGAWPRGAHKGRVSGAAALGGHVAGRRARAVYGGFPGRTRGRRKPGRRYTAGGPGIAGGGGPIAGARRAAAQDGRKTL